MWQDQVRAFSKITTVCVADYGLSDSIEKMAQVAIDGMPERFVVIDGTTSEDWIEKKIWEAVKPKVKQGDVPGS